MRIVIGCDHTGVALKVALQETALAEHSVIDVGTDSTDSVDYPDIARAAVAILRRGRGPGDPHLRHGRRDGHRGRPAKARSAQRRSRPVRCGDEPPSQRRQRLVPGRARRGLRDGREHRANVAPRGLRRRATRSAGGEDRGLA